MKAASADAKIDSQQHATLRADYARVCEERDALKQQLDWFKRQLFGRKSEKRLIDNPDQLDLSAVLGDAVPPGEPPATEKISYTRRKGKQRSDDCVTDAGLRFDDRVPIESIVPLRLARYFDRRARLRRDPGPWPRHCRVTLGSRSSIPASAAPNFHPDDCGTWLLPRPPC